MSQAATQSGGVDGNLERSALAVQLWTDKQRREVKVGVSFLIELCHPPFQDLILHNYLQVQRQRDHSNSSGLKAFNLSSTSTQNVADSAMQ